MKGLLHHKRDKGMYNMRQMIQMMAMTLGFIVCVAHAEDGLVDGDLIVTSNLFAQAVVATNASVETLQVSGVVALTGNASIGVGACAVTNSQALVMGDGLVSHGDGTITALGFFGDGAGLTNVLFSNMAAGSVGSDALALGSVTTSAIADGAVTSNKITAGSVGMDKVILSDWISWGDGRYLVAAGGQDLVMNPGRVVAGYGLNVANIATNACGASQKGGNAGLQSIGEWALGASQNGYNSGTQMIGFVAEGAFQLGNNSGFQSISNLAYGASQLGQNSGIQTIGMGAYGATQKGYNKGYQFVDNNAFGVSQQGYNDSNGRQSISSMSYGSEQRGYNSGTQIISTVRGASQHGWNAGNMVIWGPGVGSEQRGFVSAGASATNRGKGSIQLLWLTNSQMALVTGHASIGMGACTVTNNQSLVAGDGLTSHGNGTITAYGFYGDGWGVQNLNLAPYAGENLAWDPVGKKMNASGGYSDSNAVAAVLAALPSLADGDDDTRWSGTADGLDAVAARAALGLGASATNEMSAFAPADLSRYASDTVSYSNGQLHAAVQLSFSDVTNVVVATWQDLDTDASDDLTTAGASMMGDFDMNNHRIKNLPDPQAECDAVSKDYLRRVLSSLPPQGNLSMGAFTNGAPDSFPLTF